ncbi:GDYXXLXY domain-containing protein [candidate division KSB1 bacterium]|nr:GDYXXLXY domain-containing protein [candidate division KSB1 bacterium]
MIKQKYSLIVFSVLSVFQLAVPVWMIANREITLRHGRQFRFRAAPVDPYDAFRGRYVALQFEQNTAPIPPDEKLAMNQKVYAELTGDEHGFARIAKVSANRPNDKAYVQCRVSNITDSLVYLQFPFDRYYMDEKLAPVAEAAYREHSRREAQDVYVTVRVKDGNAVLEELYIEEMPIREFLRKSL